MAANKRIKEQVFQRDGYRCLRCKTDLFLTYDHIIPISKGGKTTVENGQTLCQKCNLEKGCREIDYRKKEFKVLYKIDLKHIVKRKRQWHCLECGIVAECKYPCNECTHKDSLHKSFVAEYCEL